MLVIRCHESLVILACLSPLSLRTPFAKRIGMNMIAYPLHNSMMHEANTGNKRQHPFNQSSICMKDWHSPGPNNPQKIKKNEGLLLDGLLSISKDLIQFCFCEIIAQNAWKEPSETWEIHRCNFFRAIRITMASIFLSEPLFGSCVFRISIHGRG